MTHLAPMLAQYIYQPFYKPLPAWDLWYLLLLPLCLAIAIVYKSIRSDEMKSVPRQALGLFVFIIVVMILTGGALAALVNILR